MINPVMYKLWQITSEKSISCHDVVNGCCNV